MKPIRLLALDLDGTLLRSDYSISLRTKNAVKCTEAAKVTIVLVSGRVPAAIEPYSRLLGLRERPGYLVSNNGALIQESHTGNIVHEAQIDNETVKAICDLADAEGFPVQMFEDNVMYVSRHNKYSGYEQSLTGYREVVVENFRAMAGESCYKLTIPGDPALLSHVEKLVRTYLGEKITLFNGRPYFLDLMPRGSDKGSALARIAEILNVNAAETLAIGNSTNDEAMIRWAGIGVAMANGDERIKSIAALVTEHSNDEDGVAELIEKYFSGKEANK